MPEVRHNENENRFEVDLGDGKLAVAEYQLRGAAIVFTHTEVPPEHRKRGIAGQLAQAALDHARQAGLRVVPQCPFISAWMKRNPQYEELRAQ